ncbi:MAG: aminotransferase class I/II-fold pyridoxal phosphate-dependent enzyme [Hespellia sp.]|nr:aminotransferase class I/II-fold pyridoxal phosphate-dependent enzyme [Hespellia sp.]
MDSLFDKLTSYRDLDYYAFHMPGHKRNGAVLDVDLPYGIDITEIDGFDDLHHADGILKAAQERAAQVYRADETHFLVNGSTCGIMSAIMGCTRMGDEILVARNSHKSVYHAMYLNELRPVYVYPKSEAELELNGEISAADVKRELEAHPEVKAVMIVSPTYDGVVSDVEAIAECAHESGVPLIVDEAHGAHFGFDSHFPENANTKGADIVIHSVHKTLPALTQTALLHMNGRLVNRRRVERYLHMLQTSSPSYVLMASIDSCVEMLADDARRKELFGNYVEILKVTRERLRNLKCLQLLETEHFDPSKLVISVRCVKGYTSRELYQELLETYHLQMEMVTGTYVLAMTTIGDTRSGMERLGNALCEIDERLSQGDRPCGIVSRRDRPCGIVSQRDRPCGIAEVMDKKFDGETESRTFAESIGYISTEFAYLYPPGTPILVPGERVTKEVAAVLEGYEEKGFEIEGLENKERIEVWING